MREKLPDQASLLTEQYKNSSNLNARMQLYARFSTNTYRWSQWVLDQFDCPPNGRILELGSGPGKLWLDNIDRLPADWDITLSDISPGMLAEAQANLQASQRPFQFANVDAQSIPFDNEEFDAVIANHMLYHVPDRKQAFSEIHRVLKPGGRFYASTNGRNHLRQLGELTRPFVPKPTVSTHTGEGFSLENGLEQLSHCFSDVTVHRYENALVVTEAEALIAYILSGNANVTDDKLAAFIKLVEDQIAAQGAIRIDTATGMFEAHQEG